MNIWKILKSNTNSIISISINISIDSRRKNWNLATKEKWIKETLQTELIDRWRCFKRWIFDIKRTNIDEYERLKKNIPYTFVITNHTPPPPHIQATPIHLTNTTHHQYHISPSSDQFFKTEDQKLNHSFFVLFRLLRTSSF